METSQNTIEALLSNPSESLNVEIKRWIDPRSPSGEAKIAIACMALRNRNGGYLIVGIDNETLKPDSANAPADAASVFHVDIIQSLVSKYASIPFEISVKFGALDGQAVPVIVVGAGVTIPVASKRELMDGTKRLIAQNGVYFRTLGSNGVPSSSLAVHSDWREIFEICFENREADIGRFLRRHLGSDVADRFARLSVDGGAFATPLQSRTVQASNENEQRRREVFQTEEFRQKAASVAEFGWWSATLVIDPPLSPNENGHGFLNKVAAANPRYSGWPVWLDSRNFNDLQARPRRIAKAWESIVLSDGRGRGAHADFYRIKSSGEFYLWRVLQDDLTDQVAPKAYFDPSLMIYRVGETIAVGLALVRELLGETDGTLAFNFRWGGLQGRRIDAWADRRRYFSDYGLSYDDETESYVELPSDTPQDAIARYVAAATQELFATWNGFVYPMQSIEQSVGNLLTRSNW
ncbi:ATP-binding protein (plasmid) [Rhizobium ruizarguesonis]|uniref:AlbA family DNA-binding domain-containing protein n=1 Tax=Rhizobium ruizarguesonis TaxID=2081791 RepID=UPI00102F9699|nr:ATP-binding protein [Rhizobium ruizarguesonis]TAZ71103.1 ATP-binding protein [Rhizobium ruizarguesonis]